MRAVSRKEQAEASRARLVDAGRQCFTEQGYAATTVAAVLERAGMARGALYHYFPGGKRELFTAVVEAVDEPFHHGLEAVLELPSPLARIRAGVRVFLELCTQEDFARIILAEATIVAPGQWDGGGEYELLRTQLTEAQAAGEVGADIPVDVTAASLYGAARRAGEFVIAADDRDAAAAAAVRGLDALLDGLAASAL